MKRCAPQFRILDKLTGTTIDEDHPERVLYDLSFELSGHFTLIRLVKTGEINEQGLALTQWMAIKREDYQVFMSIDGAEFERVESPDVLAKEKECGEMFS